MAALISSVLGNAGKLSEYMEECHRLGIEVLPPHVNYSENGFTVVGGVIRYGLLAIKNLGRGVIARMIQERTQGGMFSSFYNFCSRMQGKDMNKRAVESLIKSGALDGLGNNRREMILAVGTVMDSLETEKRKNLEGQIGLFGLVENEREEDVAVIPSAEDFSPEEKLRLEKEVTGMYLSGHPMAAYKAAYDRGMAARIDRIIASAAGEINTYKDEQRVNVLGVISSVKKKITKSNSSMAFVTLEDMYGTIEVLVFPSVYENYMNFIREGASVFVRGRVSFTEEKDPKILCDGIEAPPTEEVIESFKGRAYVHEQQMKAPADEGAKDKPVSNPGLYLKVKDMNWELYIKAMKYIEVFDGTSSVYIYDMSRKKLVRAPARYNVDINDILVRELKKLLGNGNVAIKMG